MPLVSGHVHSPGGAPLPGVPVLAFRADDSRRRVQGHSDASGRWALELPAGEWVVRPLGHESHRVQVADDAVALEDSAVGAGSVPGRDSIAAALARRRAEAGGEGS